jgi:hypothetical protein
VSQRRRRGELSWVSADVRTAPGALTGTRKKSRVGHASTSFRSSRGASTSQDARLAYEDHDRQLRHEDIEVVTPQYRGAHVACAAVGLQILRLGFTVNTSGRCGGGGRRCSPRLIEELLK